jgi:hypothetical protein
MKGGHISLIPTRGLLGVQLAKVFQVLQGNLEPEQVQDGVLQGARVPVREDKPVPTELERESGHARRVQHARVRLAQCEFLGFFRM